MQTVAQSTLSKRRRLAPAAYSLNEFASLLNVSYTTAHERAKAGRLPVRGFQVGRQWKFPKADVDRLLGIAPDLVDAGQVGA